MIDWWIVTCKFHNQLHKPRTELRCLFRTGELPRCFFPSLSPPVSHERIQQWTIASRAEGVRIQWLGIYVTPVLRWPASTATLSEQPCNPWPSLCSFMLRSNEFPLFLPMDVSPSFKGFRHIAYFSTDSPVNESSSTEFWIYHSLPNETLITMNSAYISQILPIPDWCLCVKQ